MKYIVETAFTFYGSFHVEAGNENEAKELIEKQCGMTINRGIYTTANKGACTWEFDPHPEKTISRVLAEADEGELL